MMKNQNVGPSLPTSLKKMRTRQVIKRIIPCCLLLIFFLFIIIYWGEEIFWVPHQNARRVVYAIFLLLPFVVTGVPFKLIDKRFSGTVLEVDLKEKVGSYSMGGKIWPCTRQDLVLTIKKDSGKIFTYTALSMRVREDPRYHIPDDGRIQDHERDFSVGDRVVKYYGFSGLYVTPQTCDSRRRCIVCGAQNGGMKSVCEHCRAELLP